MEIVQIIDSAIYEYYSEHNLPVPNWKLKKDPQWWIDSVSYTHLTLPTTEAV